MANERAERRLAAILAADVVGYSALMERDEDRTLTRLKAHRREFIEPLVAEYQGRVVKLMGDGALVEFASVVDAVRCAVLIQQGMAEREAGVPEAERVRFRIGINLGDVVREADGDLYGDGVNIAARLEQLAEPGGVVVSGTAYDHLQGKLDLPLEFAGEQRVKNIERPVRAYRVRMDGNAARFRLPVRRVRRLAPPAAAALLLALALAGGAWHLWPGEPPPKQRPGIAVLPFDDYGGAAATRRLADGLTEDVITDLARFQDLDVIARNSTETYKGKAVDVRQVGRDLDVGYVLEGSVQREGERVRVTAQLVDAGSGAHVWSERWDRPAGDVFAIQAEIADATAAKIGGWGLVQQADHAKARRKPPGSLTAYDLVVMARETLQTYTKEQAEAAIRLATRAIEADPGYARAWVTRAAGYNTLAQATGDFASAIPKMEADARRALALDPQDAEAHAQYGEALAYGGRLAEAEVEFDRALALNPSSADLAVWFAAWSSSFGQPERGVAIVDRALRLNPRFPPWYRNAMRDAYFFAGRFVDAVRAVLGREAGSTNVSDRIVLAASYGHLGRAEEARRAAEALLREVPAFSAELGVAFGYFFARERERDLFVEGLRKAGLRVCATAAELAPHPNAARLPECVTS